MLGVAIQDLMAEMEDYLAWAAASKAKPPLHKDPAAAAAEVPAPDHQPGLGDPAAAATAVSHHDPADKSDTASDAGKAAAGPGPKGGVVCIQEAAQYK